MDREYVSLVTGEIANSIGEVFRIIISDFKNYHILNIRWRRWV